MFKFLLGVLVGAYFSVEILSFLNGTGIPQEMEQQYKRYQIQKDDQQ